jgi:hypothetical protein
MTKVAIENVNHPGKVERVDAVMQGIIKREKTKPLRLHRV